MTAAGIAAVFAAGVAAALATGLGALPLLLVRRRSGSLLGGANALAGGVMLSVALVLVVEGAHDSPALTVAGGDRAPTRARVRPGVEAYDCGEAR